MKRNKRSLHWLPKALAVGLILLVFLVGLSRLERGSSELQRQQLEDTIRRTCVACYATEGVYPPTLDYLQQHYGLQLDRSRYTVFYEIFAENLMPEITVVSNES